MGVSDVCATEDAVQAFLDYLVDPMLPAKYCPQDTPSKSQLQSVAKQVHAVVLLYNFYHRKEHPQLEYLGFESFCKLAVLLKPNFLAHMELMRRSNDSTLDDSEKQFSLTEKAVINACDIATSLDASNAVPSKEWPISKVAVFLIDSKRENCSLQFCSITQGVWSVIEKDIDVSSDSSEGTIEGTRIRKKTTVTKAFPRDEYGADEVGLQQLAFSAVKDAAGINQSDLIIVKSHDVYSLGKEKTTTRFYIMQCTKPNMGDAIQIPIEDVIDSLRGPLVTKTPGRWIPTQVVEYFHLLPYARIVSDWHSREVFSNSLIYQNTGLGTASINSFKMTENPCEPEVHDNGLKPHANAGVVEYLGSKMSYASTKSPKQKDSNGCGWNGSPNAFNGPNNVRVDDSSAIRSKNEDKSKNIADKVELEIHQEIMTSCLESDLNGSMSVQKAEKDDLIVVSRAPECKDENLASGKKICDTILHDQAVVMFQPCMPVSDHAPVTYQPNLKGLEKLKSSIASKENELSETALKVLLSKRDKLTLQQRNIEYEIAQCDRSIQIILNGSEDDLALKIETVIEGCKDMCQRRITQEGAFQHFEEPWSPQHIKRKRLSEAVLSMQDACQELDCICYKNNWILPAYCVCPYDGRFQAKVTVKGVEFECSGAGELRPSLHEARESAAAQVLAKLRSLANQVQKS